MAHLPDLTPAELQRYSRHLTLPAVGEEGQRRLKGSRVLLVGAGGLGSPAALYLAAAGVGELGIVDPDRVELSNLQRQLLHATPDTGRPKVESARDRLEAVNPHVRVEVYPLRLASDNALQLLRGYDIVVDGSDNFQTRYLTNDACVLLGIPNVYGSVYRFEGQAALFALPGGPCYRCLFREPPPAGSVPTCEQGGILGVLPGIIGMIQATETIKYLLGAPASDLLAGRLLLLDAWRMRFRTIDVRQDPACPMCATGEIRELIDYEAFCGVGAASGAAPEEESGALPPRNGQEITPVELSRWLGQAAPPALLDVREPYEHRIASLPGARLVPLASLPAALASLERDRDLVVHCHHGVRSAAAVEFLREQGFTRVWNLAGGIDRWSMEVDPDLPRY